MNLTRNKKTRIENYREKTDLRGRINLTEIGTPYKVRLQNIYFTEIRSIEKAIKKYIAPLLPTIIQREDASEVTIYSNFEKAFKEAYIAHFGSLVVGGEPNIKKYEDSLWGKITRFFLMANRDHKREFDKTFKKLTGVNPIQNEKGVKDTLELASEENVVKISTISQEYFSEVQEIVMNGIRSGVSNRSITKEIQQRVVDVAGTKRTSARLIANDQVQKLNGQLDKTRQKSNGGIRYIWRTRRNDAVREDHKALDGAIFEWGYPPVTVTKGKRSGERNEPGQDINCKCQAEFVIEDALGERTKKIIKAEEKTESLKKRGRL